MMTCCPYCMSPVKPGELCPECGKDPAKYQPSSHHLPPGLLLHERYLVGRALGEGGFGITYLGLDTSLDRRVAIKEYFPTFFVSRDTEISIEVSCRSEEKQPRYEKGRAQFLREARVMARLDDIPEIVTVLEHFPENNTAYIVMEFLEGMTLRDLVAEQGPVPIKFLLEMTKPILRAMETMHQAGIIHRDISPDNLMLLKKGGVKLMDFGCARDIDGDLTETVTLKHGFAPREQYSGKDQGPWTDIYALCATMYYCLTGKVPPRATERGSGGGAGDPLVSPVKLGAALTPAQEKAILCGLAVRAGERPQSAAGLYALLYGKPMDGFPWTPPDDFAWDDIWKEDEKDDGREGDKDENRDKEKGKNNGNFRLYLVGGLCAAVLLAAAGAWISGRRPEAGGTEPVIASAENREREETAGTDRAQDEGGASAGTESGGNKLTGITGAEEGTEPEEAAGASGEPEDGAAPTEPDTTAAPTETDTTAAPTEPDTAAASAEPDTTAAPTEPDTAAAQTEPAAAEAPSQPAPTEPAATAAPSRESLQAQADAAESNGQYLIAAEAYRQMRACGYLSDSDLGEELADLGYTATFDYEFSIAAQLFSESAQLGSQRGKAFLASCYETGNGVARNEAEAFRLHLELAEAGYGASAYYKVAEAYTEGKGTEKNAEQAIYWWNRYLETGSTSWISPEKVREKIAALEAG